MVLNVGERIHVMERRRFDTDLRRHFFGLVEQVNPSTARVSGFAFLYDVDSTSYVRSAERRIRLIPLGSDGVIINVAPPETSVESVRYENEDGRLIVTDGGAFKLDINEFGRNR